MLELLVWCVVVVLLREVEVAVEQWLCVVSVAAVAFSIYRFGAVGGASLFGRMWLWKLG